MLVAHLKESRRLEGELLNDICLSPTFFEHHSFLRELSRPSRSNVTQDSCLTISATGSEATDT